MSQKYFSTLKRIKCYRFKVKRTEDGALARAEELATIDGKVVTHYFCKMCCYFHVGNARKKRGVRHRIKTFSLLTSKSFYGKNYSVYEGVPPGVPHQEGKLNLVVFSKKDAKIACETLKEALQEFKL